jgi:methylenetetrahydrofolate dehydrogenase (NAD+)
MSSHLAAPAIKSSPTEGVKVDASIVAQPFRDEIKAKVQELKSMGIGKLCQGDWFFLGLSNTFTYIISLVWLVVNSEAPLLVGLLANKDPAAVQYAEWTGKACRADGLRYELRVIDDPIDVENALLNANDDPRVHGIIVYYPIFGTEESFSGASQDDYLRDSVSVKCDVEGLCHTYRTNLYRNVRYLDYPTNNLKCLIPCTALAVVKILEHCPGCYDTTKPIGRRMEGNVVTIINRSEIVGRPLAAMLANDGAEVYSIDIESIYLFSGSRLHKVDETPESCVQKSSVVVTGVPSKNYRLAVEWIQPNTTVVNVASFKNVEEESLLKIPGVVYIPMVGKVTVAMLERNLVRLFDNFHHPTHARQEEKKVQPWYGSPLQLYTAAAVTAIFALQVMRK